MDAQATFSCSFTQSDLGPVTELPERTARRATQLSSLAGPEAHRGCSWRIKSIGSKHLCHCLIWQTVVFPEKFRKSPRRPFDVSPYLASLDSRTGS